MILIVGGAYQGKEAFAKEQFPNLHWVDGTTCSIGDFSEAEGMLNFHEYIRRGMQERQELEHLAEEVLASLQVVVTDELGYGIVPMDAFDRAYREKTGRICTEIASGADKVYRVICGIGTVIKG